METFCQIRPPTFIPFELFNFIILIDRPLSLNTTFFSQQRVREEPNYKVRTPVWWAQRDTRMKASEPMRALMISNT